MQKIIVERSTLKKKVLEIERDGMEFVELHIVSCQQEDGRLYPAFLHFEGISKRGVHKDYESVDELSATMPLYVIRSA